MVNSGSSANLLAFFCITNALKKNKVKVSCIITNNAKKLLNANKLKKSLTGKIYTDANETKEKMGRFSRPQHSLLWWPNYYGSKSWTVLFDIRPCGRNIEHIFYL